MRRWINFTFLALLFLSACASKKYENPHIEIETQFGDIEVELYPKQAPKTVAAFLKNVDAGYYEKASFYRVLSDENQPSFAPKSNLIQGGIWKTNQALAEKLPTIPHETTQQTGLQHMSGTISMARQDTGTAKSEFFICTDDQPGFNYGGNNNPDKQGYAAFGKVVKGMQVVRKIQTAPETNQSFEPPVTIWSIKRL